jgi:antitoxin VapB
MTTEHTKVFTSNRSQAVRLPKAVAFPPEVQEVEITAVGPVRVIAPKGRRWDTWFDGPTTTEDFMPERDQPLDQERESF